jgi:hypothetical protein
MTHPDTLHHGEPSAAGQDKSWQDQSKYRMRLILGAGFVDSLARPGGNATGFTPFEYGLREVA